MSNAASGSAYQPRGRCRTREVSPLTQSYIPSSDDESFFGTDTDASSAPPSPQQTIQHRRKASRIEDVNELNLDLLSLTAVSQPATKPLESKQSQPLPKSPDPPTPPPKPSPTLVVAPLKIRKKPLRSAAKPILSIVTSPMTTPRAVRLLVASIGNPKPYHSTRHSAGHHLLQALQSNLGFPTLTKGKTGLVSSGSDAGRPQFTLWQSTSSMNVSGKNLLQAWKMFSASQADPDAVTGLVVLHDELESASGVLKLRRGDGSAKGHNGIKSIQNSFKMAGVLDQLGDKRYIRVGIGIGRPQSRDPSDVSAYVLGQLTGKEKKLIEAKAEELVRMLEKEVQTLSTLA